MRIIALAILLFFISCSGKGRITGTPGMETNSLTTDTLHRISRQFVFTEGPAPDEAGNIYFTDQPRNQIWKYDVDGNLSLFMDSTGRSNGLYIYQGKIISCADQDNELWSISTDKKIEVLLKAPAGKAFNGPNDLWPDSRGGIYFTDPYYQRDYWTRKKSELGFEGLYYLPKGASTAFLVDSTMVKPNGIVGSADGSTLYVSDIGAGKTYRYAIGENGLVKNRELFVEQGSDGMTLDNLGNLYLTGKGVTVFDAAGKKITQIEVPSKWVGNICFGGRERNILFVTASESVYSMKMNVKGIQ